MDKKICKKCKKEKLFNEFYKDKTKRDGLRFECKECTRIRHRQRTLKKNPDAKTIDRKLNSFYQELAKKGLKWCNTCKKGLPFSEFYKYKGARDGLRFECKECIAQYRQENKEQRAQYLAQYRQQYKQEYKNKTFNAYGGVCNCEGCEVTKIYAMELDHINNDGAEHRKQIGGLNLWHWALKNNFPSILQMLCGTCHNGKTYTKSNNCPDKGTPHNLQPGSIHLKPKRAFTSVTKSAIIHSGQQLAF